MLPFNLLQEKVQTEKHNKDILLKELDFTNNIPFLNDSSLNMKTKTKRLRFIIIWGKKKKLNKNLGISQTKHTFEDKGVQ